MPESENAPDPNNVDAVSPADLDARLDGYHIEDILGVGGMGTVYRGLQERLDRPVAIKTLTDSLAEPEFVERFEAEAKAMARLHHPNIVAIYDFGEAEGGTFYMVMELVAGRTLHDAIHDGGFTENEAVEVIGKVCDALDYAHSQGMIHRDIKPPNVLIGEDGAVKVVDFGLARLLASGHFARNTESGTVLATPGYAAPEITMAGATVDQRADIFALGALLYETLAGSPPPEPGKWVPPSRIAGTNPALDAVILRAMKRDPDDRYSSAAKLKAAIEQARRTRHRTRTRARPTTPTKAKVVAPAIPATPVVPTAPATVRRKRPLRRPVNRQSETIPAIVWIVAVLLGLLLLLIWQPWSSGSKKTKRKPNKDSLIPTALPEEPFSSLPPIDTPEWDPYATPSTIVVFDPPEPQLAALLKGYDASLARTIAQPHHSAIDDLNSKYIEAIKHEIETAPGAKDAAAALALKTELKRIKAQQPGQLAANGTPKPHPILAPLQERYQAMAKDLTAQHARTAATFTRGQLSEFERLAESQRREGREHHAKQVDDAVADLEQQIATWEDAARPDPGSPESPVILPSEPITRFQSEAFTIEHGDAHEFSLRPGYVPIFAGTTGFYAGGGEYARMSLPNEENPNWSFKVRTMQRGLVAYCLTIGHPNIDFARAEPAKAYWSIGREPAKLIHRDEGIAMLCGMAGQWGKSEGAEVRIGDDGFWYLSGRGHPRAVCSANAISFKWPEGERPNYTVREYRWTKGRPGALRMIRAADGICALGALTGPFVGTGESVRLEIRPDGYWYLVASAKRDGTFARALAFVFENA